MPINAGHEYENAEKEYLQAKTLPEKIKGLQKMLSVSPSHKGAEKLRSGIKQRISKYKSLIDKEKKASKGKGSSFSIKKEGAAQVVLIGKTNSGKSTLLSKLTNAKPIIADYEYTTIIPEIGSMDYNGVIIQIIEIPAISENFIDKEKGPMFLAIIRNSDLIVILATKKEDISFIKKELELAGIDKWHIIVNSKDDVYKIKEKIWEKLNLIYVYTKSPGKEKEYPPLALKKGSLIEDFARSIHKDFVKRFKYAKVWGKSAKHNGMKCGLKHMLKTGDIVELHTK